VTSPTKNARGQAGDGVRGKKTERSLEAQGGYRGGGPTQRGIQGAGTEKLERRSEEKPTPKVDLRSSDEDEVEREVRGKLDKCIEAREVLKSSGPGFTTSGSDEGSLTQVMKSTRRLHFPARGSSSQILTGKTRYGVAIVEDKRGGGPWNNIFKFYMAATAARNRARTSIGGGKFPCSRTPRTLRTREKLEGYGNESEGENLRAHPLLKEQSLHRKILDCASTAYTMEKDARSRPCRLKKARGPPQAREKR